MTRALLAAALYASAFAATTLSLPAVAQQDPRLVNRLYDPTEVVRVEGKVNVQATIRFGEGEQIQNVAIGDSQKWQVTPSRSANLLFVKPLAERATTNMTVVTDRNVYLFDLVSSPGHRNPLYVLNFTYPVVVPTEAEEELAARELANATEMAAANDDYAVIDPATLNFAWVSEGVAALLPEQIYDNGDATFMEWPVGAAMPAILVKDDSGTEGPVNFAVRGNVIVIDRVPGEIILRSGDDYARLVHAGATHEVSVRTSKRGHTAVAGA